MKAVVIIVAILYFLFIKKYEIKPKKTIAIVACPLGKANPTSFIKPFDGRALWNISFKSFTKTPAIKTVEARKTPSLLFFLIYR